MIALTVWMGCVFVVKAQNYYHQLSADEFANRDGGMPGILAYTSCHIELRCRATNDKRNNINVTYDVQLVFNRDKSWIDRRQITSTAMLAEVVKHEQGHYTIAFMQQQELLRTLNKTRFGPNYKAQAAAIFDQIEAKYKQLNDNYDEDTRRSLDREQQHSWDEYFKKRIMYMPPSAV